MIYTRGDFPSPYPLPQGERVQTLPFSLAISFKLLYDRIIITAAAKTKAPAWSRGDANIEDNQLRMMTGVPTSAHSYSCFMGPSASMTQPKV